MLLSIETAIVALVLSHDMGCRRALALKRPDLTIEQTIASCKVITDVFKHDIMLQYDAALKAEQKKKGKKK